MNLWYSQNPIFRVCGEKYILSDFVLRDLLKINDYEYELKQREFLENTPTNQVPQQAKKPSKNFLLNSRQQKQLSSCHTDVTMTKHHNSLAISYEQLLS